MIRRKQLHEKKKKKKKKRPHANFHINIPARKKQSRSFARRPRRSITILIIYLLLYVSLAHLIHYTPRPLHTTVIRIAAE